MHSQSPGAKLSLTSSSDEQFVEVFHNNHWSDSGSERVWHQARVLRERTRGGLKEVFVEYRHIKAPRPDGKNPGDSDPGEKEWVVKSRVRPDPQRAGRDDSDRLLLSSLAPGSAVELYADEAWWEGYVLEHVPPREGGGKEWLRIVYKDRLDEVTQVSPRRRLDPEQERVRTAFDWRGPQRRWARREADPDFVAVQRHPNWKSMPNQPQKSPAAAASGEGQDRKRQGQVRLTVSLQVPRPAREASGAAQPSRSGQGQGAAEREQRPGQRSAPESSAALGGKQGAATPRPSGSNASGRQPSQAQPRQGSSASRGRSSSKPARSGEERRSRKGGKPVELGKRSRAGAAFDEQAAAAILHQVTELPDGSPSGLPVGSKAQDRTAAAAQPSPQRPGGASPERAQSVELVCEAAGQAAGSDGPSTSGSHGCPPRSRAAKAVAPTPADDTASSGGSSRGEQRRRYSGSSSWQVQHYRSAVKSAQCRARAITLVQDRRRSANTDTRGPAVSTKRQAQPALPCGLFLAPEFGERSSMVCVDNLGGLSPRTVEEELHRLFSTTLHSVSVSCSQLGEPGPQQLQRWHGWACLRFPTYLEASRAILKLRKMYWRRDDTPVLRPVIAHFPRWTQYPWGSTDMRRPGDLLLPEDVYSHSAQPNHWEFDAGQEWRQLHLVGREAKAELAAQFAEELVEELVVHLAAELGQSCLHPPQESWQEAEEGSTGIGPDAHRPTCRSLWLKGLPARVSEEQLRRSLEQFCPDNVQPLAVIPLNVVSGQPHGVALIQLENAGRAHHILRNMTEGLWMMFSCPAPIEAALYQPGGPRGLQAVFDRAHQALLQRPWAPEPPGLQEAQLVELPNPERGDAFDRAAAAVRRLMEAQEQAGTLLKAMRLERELQLHQSQQAELKRLAHDLNRHNDLVELLDEHASPDPA